ncbi:PadR family transcriptional regulator [Oscillospiraceae bacterium MB08-C2-2]|nr:PadR family transcriptional regulator [Oscillospiraceae bacterium MB08-C2-2]
MSLSHGILGFLSYGSMTGYDLSKAFGSSVKFFWYAQTSQIYLELGKLEKKELVTCQPILQTDKPNKKLYSITESGRTEFLHWLSDENTGLSKGTKDAFLMKVFFSGSNPPEKCIAMLEQFSEDCQTYLAEMSHIPQAIERYSQQVEPYQTIYWELAADFGYTYTQTCITWAKKSIERLREIL